VTGGAIQDVPASVDTFTSGLSFFGRLTDDVSRQPASPRDFRVLLTGTGAPGDAIYKEDGHFAFASLRPSPAYAFLVASDLYQGRAFEKPLPGGAPVELAFDGEDEVYLVVRAVSATSKQITFDPIPFLPPVRRGARVVGEGGVATTLADDCGGAATTSAVLADVTGFVPGRLVRIVRSHSLRVKAGPSYPFPDGTTILALALLADIAAAAPIVGARARLTKVNGQTPARTTVGGVDLRHVPIAGPPAQQPVLGTDADLDVASDRRGQAVFYFPGNWALSLLDVEISRLGFVTQSLVFTVAPGRRTGATVRLTPV
jgi:hypothetical protein